MTTILITGATDGIGRLAALRLAEAGHDLLLHGRDDVKLGEVESETLAAGAGGVSVHRADLSSLAQVDELATEVIARLDSRPLDVLINNAGVFTAKDPMTDAGLDVRFVVNTLAPYRLTRLLQRVLRAGSRVVNVASAAQSTVDLAALRGERRLGDDMTAYAQSKLALTMWTTHRARQADAPVMIALNPSSLMATKMVADAFGIDDRQGNDPARGAGILVSAATGEEFADASGAWFDGDTGPEGEFASAHADARDEHKAAALVDTLDDLLREHGFDQP